MLPGLGIFSSTLKNFRVRSETRPFYGVTIPMRGSSQFLTREGFQDYYGPKGHLQHPDRMFDAQMGESSFDSLQLCFEEAHLDCLARKLHGQDGEKASLMETLDFSNPAMQSFGRHAMFIWNELLRGGPIASSAMIAQESSNLLGALLVSAADENLDDPGSSGTGCSAVVRRAEEYLMDHLDKPVCIADVAQVAGASARSLSRGFRRYRGTTIKGFVKERRLEEANRRLLTAEPGVTNVTEVALNLGFDQLGRFSRDYKTAFGELPSETLAR